MHKGKKYKGEIGGGGKGRRIKFVCNLNERNFAMLIQTADIHYNVKYL